MSMKPFHGVANQWRSSLVTTVDDNDVSVVLTSPSQPNPSTPFKFSIDTERLRCTSYVVNSPSSGKTTYTVERGADGTVAAAHTAGARAIHYADAAEVTELQTAVVALTGMLQYLLGGAGSFIVGDSDSLKVKQQTVPNMTLIVQAGGGVVEGQPVALFSEVTTPALTAPTTNPKIAIIQIDQDSELSVKYGAEAGSPSAPSPDANKMVLAEVLINVADTSLVNADIDLTVRVVR